MFEYTPSAQGSPFLAEDENPNLETSPSSEPFIRGFRQDSRRFAEHRTVCGVRAILQLSYVIHQIFDTVLFTKTEIM